MSVLAMDSFDWNGGTFRTNRYTSVSGSPQFINSSPMHEYSVFVNASNEYLNYDIGTQDGNILIIGTYIRFSQIYASGFTPFLYVSGSVNFQCFLSIHPTTHKLEVRNGNLALLGTGSHVIQYNTWYQIEWKIKVTNSTSAGECILKIDGIEDINLVGVDTQFRATNLVDLIVMGTSSASTDIQFDDFYVLDTIGTYANDFIGPFVHIECLEPNGNGNSNDFVGSDANSVDNYLHVDEIASDEDTSYVESSTIGHKDSYTFDNLAGSVDSIMAIQTMTCHKKVSGAGARTAKHFIRRSAADYEGPTTYTLSDGTYKNDIELWVEDPSTAAQWIEADVNALEAGIKVQA